MTQEEYVSDAVDLLKKLIATPSVSRNEKEAADIMEQTIRKYGFEPHREANNIWIIDPHYDESRPTLLLNAHIDTVKPVASWTRNPFSPDVEEGILYGLGSNDCGGGLCSLLQIFRMLTAKPQQYNLIYLASAEEEVSGKDGITRALPLLPHIDLAIFENGQYNEDWRYIHTMPEQLPAEIHELDAAKVLPVHNSKFSLSRHAWDEPVHRIEQAATKDSSLHIIHGIIGSPIIY